MPTVEETIKHLQNTYNKDEVIAYDIWSTYNAIERAHNKGILDFTVKQAKEVINCLHQKIDNEQGISWITLDWWIDEIVERNKK